MQPNPKWRGDPTFLPELLKFWGLDVAVLDGAFDRGHGDFGAIQGIVVHHIGSNRYDAWNIARHPSLGLCSQLHLSRAGKVTVCGVGIAYHAGRGWFDGWPTNNANAVSIGVEAESDGVSPWPQEELDAYYKLCAAILWFLGKRATTQTLLAHWEYSMAAQGKWDPGAGNGKSGAVMNMDEFRARVNYYIDNPPFKEKKENVVAFVDDQRRFRSRVEGSEYHGTPLDYLLNADAHSFVTRANTNELLKRLDQVNARLVEISGRLDKLEKKGG